MAVKRSCSRSRVLEVVVVLLAAMALDLQQQRPLVVSGASTKENSNGAKRVAEPPTTTTTDSHPIGYILVEVRHPVLVEELAVIQAAASYAVDDLPDAPASTLQVQVTDATTIATERGDDDGDDDDDDGGDGGGGGSGGDGDDDRSSTLCITTNMTALNITQTECNVLPRDNDDALMSHLVHLLKAWHWQRLLAVTPQCSYSDLNPYQLALTSRLHEEGVEVLFRRDGLSPVPCAEEWRANHHIGLLFATGHQDAADTVLTTYQAGFFKQGNVLLWLPDLVLADLSAVTQDLLQRGHNDVAAALEASALVLTPHGGGWAAATRRIEHEHLGIATSGIVDVRNHFDANVFDAVAAAVRTRASLMLQHTQMIATPLHPRPLLGQRSTATALSMTTAHTNILRGGTYTLQRHTLRAAITAANESTTGLVYYTKDMGVSPVPVLLLHPSNPEMFPHSQSPVALDTIFAFGRSNPAYATAFAPFNALRTAALEFFAARFPHIRLNPRVTDTFAVPCDEQLYGEAQRVPDAVIGTGPGTCIPEFGRVVARDGVPLLVPGLPNTELSDKGTYPTLFRLGTTTAVYTHILAHMLEDLGASCVSMVYNADGGELAETFVVLAQAEGLEVRLHLPFHSASSTSAVLDSIIAADSQHVLVSGHGVEVIDLLEEAHGRGMLQPPWVWIIAGPSVTFSAFPPYVVEALDGILLTTTPGPACTSPIGKEFLAFESSSQHTTFTAETASHAFYLQFVDAINAYVHAVDATRYTFGFEFDQQRRRAAVLQGLRAFAPGSPLPGIGDPHVQFDGNQDAFGTLQPAFLINSTFHPLSAATIDQDFTIDEAARALVPIQSACRAPVTLAPVGDDAGTGGGGGGASTLSSGLAALYASVLVLAALIIVATGMAVEQRRRAKRKTAMRTHDFRAELEEMQLTHRGIVPAELKRQHIQIENKLGEGFFSQVWKGTLMRPPQHLIQRQRQQAGTTATATALDTRAMRHRTSFSSTNTGHRLPRRVSWVHGGPNNDNSSRDGGGGGGGGGGGASHIGDGDVGGEGWKQEPLAVSQTPIVTGDEHSDGGDDSDDSNSITFSSSDGDDDDAWGGETWGGETWGCDEKHHDAAYNVADDAGSGGVGCCQRGGWLRRLCLALAALVSRWHNRATVIGDTALPVAVKMTRAFPDGTYDDTNLRYEAASLAQFRHCKNIVQLLGVVTAGDQPMLLVLEYCEHGALDSFLQRYTLRRQLDWATKLKMARDIARVFS